VIEGLLHKVVWISVDGGDDEREVTSRVEESSTLVILSSFLGFLTIKQLFTGLGIFNSNCGCGTCGWWVSDFLLLLITRDPDWVWFDGGVGGVSFYREKNSI